MITPEHITSLKPNEVFVFGANLAGIHGAGAAKLAQEKFGAFPGVFLHTGRSYGIPTKDKDLKVLPLEEIGMWVDLFLSYAEIHPELTFLVTKIGCGLAGYTPDQIASLFHMVPSNVSLPKEFWEVLQR